MSHMAFWKRFRREKPEPQGKGEVGPFISEVIGSEVEALLKSRRKPADTLMACENLAKLQADNPDLWAIWAVQGTAFCALDRYEEALQSFDKAIRLKPEYSTAWHGKGISLLKLGKAEEALAALEKAPNNYLVWYQRGCVLGSLGRYNESAKALQESIRLNHQDDEVLGHSRSLLQEMGRYREALKANEETGDTESDNEEYPAIKYLAKYRAKYRDTDAVDWTFIWRLLDESEASETVIELLRKGLTRPQEEELYQRIDESALLSPQEKLEAMIGLMIVLFGAFPQPRLVAHLGKVFGKEFVDIIEARRDEFKGRSAD